MRAPDTTKSPTGLALYNEAADAACSRVIATYSTSFGMATRLLGKAVRQHVVNIYAVVRVADEIVDGAAAEAHALGGAVDPAIALDAYEANVYRALADGFSTDLVVHAFARSAAACGFGRDLIAPFFASMRADLSQTEHDQESFERYIYGSAEVVGLMCLAAFLRFGDGGSREYSTEDKTRLVAGARALGSAFQKVNFLRDIAADFGSLGRSYFPGIKPGHFSTEDRDRIVAEIDSELSLAAATLPLLPRNCSRAVTAALRLFGELNRKIAATPADQLVTRRIRVSDARKFVILFRSLVSGAPSNWSLAND